MRGQRSEVNISAWLLLWLTFPEQFFNYFVLLICEANYLLELSFFNKYVTYFVRRYLKNNLKIGWKIYENIYFSTNY